MKTSCSCAIAVFGSTARGDTDALSDRDLLIVDDDLPTLQRVSSVWERRGWSVSNWTWASLERQFRTGSLFAHHLSAEGRYVSDPKGRLSELFRSFRFRQCYSRTQQEALPLFSLLSKTPDTPRGVGWALDVLMTGFRTWTVPLLASRSCPAYGHEDTLRNLARLRPLGSDTLEHLRLLRIQKRRVRNGAKRHPGRDLGTYVRAVEVALGVEIPLRVVAGSEAIDSADTIRSSTASGYVKSRTIERSLIGLGQEIQSNREIDLLVKELRRRITHPRCYVRDFGANNSSSTSMYANLLVSIR